MSVNVPKVSVIIPVYNVEKYLEKCLDSVINQTYENFEIICVDDCSPDNSAAIVEKYMEKDERIKLFRHEKNKGLSGARNTGLEEATGDLIYFLDSDDWIEPNLIECAVNIFANFDVDFFCFSSKPFVEGDVIQDINGMSDYIRNKRDGVFDLNFDIMQSTNIHVWNKIYRTEKIKENHLRFIVGLLYEDIFFTWAYNFLSKKAYYETEVLHHYRVRSTSIMEKCTKNKRYEMTVDHMKNWYKLYKFVLKDKAMFLQRYDELLRLLWNYRMRAKEICPLMEKYRIEKLYFEYLEEITKQHESIMCRMQKAKEQEEQRRKEEIYRQKNSHYVINFCGIKIKIRRKKKVLVHLHVYYHEQTNFFIQKLKNINNVKWDLIVTYCNSNLKSFDKIKKLKPDAIFLQVKNSGYDIYPFIRVLRKIDIGQYDYILKLHTKNYQGKEPFYHGQGWKWRDALVNALLKNKKVFKQCLKQLNDSRVGEIGASNTLVYMGDKSPEDTYLYDSVCEKFSINNERGHFIAGSMFMVKASLMKLVRDLPCDETDFEGSLQTGDKATLAHVIERYLGTLVEQQGYIIKGI